MAEGTDAANADLSVIIATVVEWYTVIDAVGILPVNS